MPSKDGVMLERYLHVGHIWEQAIGQDRCGHCKGVKFRIVNPPNKEVHSLGSLGTLVQGGAPSWLPPQWTNGLQLA